MKISVIAPAFNEEAYLPSTLNAIAAAADALRSSTNVSVKIIVVDNNSMDNTAVVAISRGAKVVFEREKGISRARNTGARQASGDVFIFVDSDVTVPPGLLQAIYNALSDPSCFGGGVDVEYRPKRLTARLYLRSWRFLARRVDMVQGATQFCRRTSYEAVGGYDKTAWIGEDVDSYSAKKRQARGNGGHVQLIGTPKVLASSRRFDRWPIWKMLVWINPLFISIFRRRRWAWGGWYSRPVR